MKKSVFLSLIVSGAFISTELHAQSEVLQRYKRCVQERRSELESPQTLEAYKDRGCTADQTDWTGKRNDCNETVCWEAPPNNIIVDADVRSHSSNGSDNSFGETQYLPTRDAATRICNTVHARSNSGPYSGRGWQKLVADVTIRRQLSSAENSKIESECEKEILG